MLLTLALAGLLTGPPRVVTLPAGTISVSTETHIPAGFTVQGHPRGTTLRASASFQGKAVLRCSSNVTVRKLVIDGNRAALERPVEIAPSDRAFADFYDRNGILSGGAEALTLQDITLRNVANFAILVSAVKRVTMDRITVVNSGSRKANGRNNTSGGILLEEGTTNFTVRNSTFRHIRGNGVWTHSRYTSPRNGPGLIAHNTFDTIGRDALQAGHAVDVTIADNTGTRIGWPVDIVDIEGGGTPVAIDTAGNVTGTYTRNTFEEINGKCIDLDGFHDGRVSENTCTNRGGPDDYPSGHYGIVFNNTNPDMQSARIVLEHNRIEGTKFGGIFVIGEKHTIRANTLRRINTARCNQSAAKYGCLFDPKQPELLRSGIYLASRAERPAIARDNVIEGNLIEGHGMEQHCVVAAPGVDLNNQKIRANRCTNTIQ